MKFIDHTGKRIGNLTVIRKTGAFKYKSQSAVYLCKCDCGNFKEISTAEFSSAKSCGCLRAAQKSKFKTMNVNKTPSWALPAGESSRNALFKRYQKSATKRSYEFNLSLEEFADLVSKNCHYCALPPSQLTQDTARPKSKFVYSGIDRKDNALGYSKENCVPCCKTCNRAKDIMSHSSFLEWIKRVYHNSFTTI